MAGSTAHILQALGANAVIAASKGVAAVITGSGALMAETIHSAADCGNQLLLLFGVKQSRRPADATHPLGYGRALYFWSFMVALLLFVGGGVYSIYEGIHKLQHPEAVESILVGVIVLAVALAIEGWATYGNIVELNERRGAVPFFRFLRQTKDSDLVVIFGENSAAVLGLVLALVALLLAKTTGDGRWDAVGSLAVGVVLVGVAIFLAVEVKSLLVGEGADPVIETAAREIAAADPNVEGVLRVLTVQQGPGEVVVAMKVKFKPGMATGGALCDAINGFERKLEARVPEVKWTFIEPDVVD
ncbi:MAG TPA: cation diffusion facilitator family transporter [Kofleriaceae bacterium]|nr:cation diffusion facilitator family transporter [Kofleriaceae bacterium]